MAELTPGTVFAGFTIERLLGAGGMGSVHLAAHPRIPRKIALKLLHTSLTHDQHASVLFERESDHAARLDHPNIVSILDRGREGDQLWIAMQYVAGTNASEAVARAAFEPSRAVHIVGEIAKALDYAHANGVLHRDVKPANMLLEETGPGRSGRVLLADFGIAKLSPRRHTAPNREPWSRVCSTRHPSNSREPRSMVVRTSIRWGAASSTC